MEQLHRRAADSNLYTVTLDIEQVESNLCMHGQIQDRSYISCFPKRVGTCRRVKQPVSPQEQSQSVGSFHRQPSEEERSGPWTLCHTALVVQKRRRRDDRYHPPQGGGQIGGVTIASAESQGLGSADTKVQVEQEVSGCWSWSLSICFGWLLG